jgi:anti-sigma factor RsiW
MPWREKSMNEHIASEDLAAYTDGTLEGKAKAGVESHLSRCRECLEALAEIAEIRGSRVKVPAEFLRRALKIPAEGALGEKENRARAVLSMRPAFGVAAVFLVAILIGYLFVGRNRLARTGTAPVEESRALAVREAPPQPRKAKDAVAAPVDQSAPPLSAKARKAPGVKGNEAGPAVVEPPEKKMAPAAVPADKEMSLVADEAAMERRQEPAPVVGGVQAPPPKDELEAMKMTAAGSVARSILAEEYREGGKAVFRQRLAGREAAAGAVQLLLAATGRAVAPMAITISSPGPRPRFRIEGDVSMADLRNPEILDGWSWFQEGMSLELAIGPDGGVAAVTLAGTWNEQAAATASEAAKKLTFSLSDKGERRAALTVLAALLN